jgi:hypothetical protein
LPFALCPRCSTVTSALLPPSSHVYPPSALRPHRLLATTSLLLDLSRSLKCVQPHPPHNRPPPKLKNSSEFPRRRRRSLQTKTLTSTPGSAVTIPINLSPGEVMTESALLQTQTRTPPSDRTLRRGSNSAPGHGVASHSRVFELKTCNSLQDEAGIIHKTNQAYTLVCGSMINVLNLNSPR